MEQITSVWNALDTRRKTIVLGATILVFIAILTLSRMAAQPSMSLLYSGLEPGTSGDIVAALEQENVTYEIQGSSIYVESPRRDELRMTLAAEGLPNNSSKGYELLDGLSGFGTTSQMFDAAYWRAKEGELGRTIMSSPGIKSARVHIATPSPQGLRQRENPTASVTVSTSDSNMTSAHAKALKYLVASAVPGLSPEDVSVIDTRSGLVLAADASEMSPESGTDRAKDLKRSIEHLLEARVGYGNAVVELSIDTAKESETILERRFDPEGRVAISTETEETTNAATDSRTSGVTVASNLPDGDGAGGDGSSSSNNSETRERINYEVSETTREILRAPGSIRKMSVAVLVDGIRTVDENGETTWSPRSQEELDGLRELVASAAGLDEERGDTLTIKTMEFEPLLPLGTEAAPGLLARLNIDLMSLIQLVVLALVTLVLGLFVVRPILSTQQIEAEALPAPEPDIDNSVPGLPSLTGEIDEGDFAGGPEMAVVSDFDFGGDSGLPALGGSSSADPVDRLRSLIEERQAETVEILRGWMEDDEAEDA
ncbi:MAG: flagellar basal-body MS-ring/collar protein FliF [Maritimibacter sp.]